MTKSKFEIKITERKDIDQLYLRDGDIQKGTAKHIFIST